MSFPRYPEYRNSGVKWLGDVPNNWPVYRVKQTTYLKGRVGWKGLTSDEYLEYGDAYLVTGTDFSGKFIDWSGCHHVDISRYEDDPYIQLKDGDLLITKDGTIGKLALVRNLDKPACLNSGIFLVRPLKAYTTRYMYWVLSSTAFSVFCDLSSTGSTIQHLYQNVFENFVFPAPSLLEQNAISDFLDHETAKIDALVAEQEKLIALLKEKRQAVISHAVTKGLNPDAPMKDSGIEWLGKVPAHWDVCSLRRVVAAIEQGWSPECHAREAEENEWGVLKAGCLNGGVFRPSENKALPPELSPDANYEVRIGDVLMSRASGSPELVGSTALVSTTRSGLMLSDKIFRLRLQTAMTPRYFVAAFNSRALRVQIENALSGGNGMANNLPQSNLMSFVIPVPPQEEQISIADFIEAEIGRLGSLRTESERTIVLMKERRSALISAAVTGKIDVRNFDTEGRA